MMMMKQCMTGAEEGGRRRQGLMETSYEEARSAATLNSPSLYSFLRLAADLLHFNMSCIGVILQVRGPDGMSTP